jgi:uncharacterized repeat protein (TIGR03806 family)
LSQMINLIVQINKRMVRVFVIGLLLIILINSSFKSHAPAYPENLSEWGLFEGKMSQLIPKKEMIPYTLNTPLYSDYAEKSRFIRLAKGATIDYKAQGVLDFPVGTLIAKNFYYSADQRNLGKDIHVIETRLLIHESEGWKAMTYVWNEDQLDAVLEIAGDHKQIKFINSEGEAQQVRYVIPNQNQCKGCHNSHDKIAPIGPSIAQLNGDYIYDGGKKNQIEYLKSHGYLKAVPNSKLPKMAVWNDPSTGDVNARARAYLEINCAHCHRSEGPAQTSGLYLTSYETNPTALGINKTPVAAGNGSGGNYFDIVPGDAKASILLYRMKTKEPGERMPELGRSLVHDEGVNLIQQWINEMKTN